jgi:hypothetical protein
VAKNTAPTKAEEHLLRYPPTEDTWICQAKLVRTEFAAAGEPKHTAIRCNAPNSRYETERCWCCARPKPAKPKRLWPLYLKVCEKHGHTPGEPWRPLAGGDESRNATEGGRTSTPASGTKTRSRRRKRE